MALLKYVVLLVFLKYLVLETSTEGSSSAENDTAEQDKDRCAQLAQFTPNLCDNDVAKKRCAEQCGENGNLPGNTSICSI